jgi:phosphoglycerate kinase
MTNQDIDPGLPLIQDADLSNKVVLVRVDHNVVKKGEIRDPYRIDATLGTLYNIVERGGRLILMTHVGRPRDKKTGRIKIEENSSVQPVVEYLESDTIEGRIEGKYRNRSIRDFKKGDKFGYFLDVVPESFDAGGVAQVIGSARTIFVNAVMGLTPHFFEGSEKLYRTIDRNREAQKFYGGGDTLQEFKNLSPGLYLAAMDNAQYYFFTGGGTVLKAIEEGTPYGLEPVKALIENNKERS